MISDFRGGKSDNIGQGRVVEKQKSDVLNYYCGIFDTFFEVQFHYFLCFGQKNYYFKDQNS